MKFKLLFSLVLLAGFFFVACNHDAPASKLPAATAESKNVKYQCPMDCEKGKLYDQPGACPVCKMDLKAVEVPDSEGHGGHHHEESKKEEGDSDH